LIQIVDPDDPGVAIDRLDLGPRAYVEPIAPGQERALGNEELIALFDLVADVIGEAAIGE